jgi:hypothetical protein
MESQIDPAYLGQYAGDHVYQRGILRADKRNRITGAPLPLQPDYIDWLHLVLLLLYISFSKIGVKTANYCHSNGFKKATKRHLLKGAQHIKYQFH